MKTTGITRRIDELGRIVIPKEIRKNMHIKTGDLLEVYLRSQDEISLKKFSLINENQEFINEYIKKLSKKLDCNVFLTNMDEIIFSNVSLVINDKITEELIKYSNNNKPSLINLTEDYRIENSVDIYPLSPNGDLIGFLIFEYKTNIDDTKSELVKFSISFLQSYLENN